MSRSTLNKRGMRRFWSISFGFVVAFAAFSLNAPKLFAADNPASTTDTGISAKESPKPTLQAYSDEIRRVFSTLDECFVEEIDKKAVYQAAVDAMMKSVGDQYTVYLDKTGARDLKDTTDGSFGGVGLTFTKAAVSTDEKPAYVVISYPVKGGPGDKAGIQKGDMISKINGQPTPEMTQDEVVSLLRGKVGESVGVTVMRGKTVEFDVTLVREVIEIPTVTYCEIGDDIGYMHISEFTPKTPIRVQNAVASFKGKGLKKLVVDLRGNPGGLLSSAVAVADKFIESGVIVSTKGRMKSVASDYKAHSETTTVDNDVQIVLLIDKGSASASEIVAGALKDHKKAFIVGETSYGKGSVQQVLQLRHSDAMKLTVARYYTPSDANIDKTGIPPDREIKFPEMTEDDEAAYKALISDKAIQAKAEENPNMSEEEIAKCADELYETYRLDKRILRRLVRLETRLKTKVEDYDLDFDMQLQEAVSILRNESVKQLIRSTKTVKQLQEEASAAEKSSDE